VVVVVLQVVVVCVCVGGGGTRSGLYGERALVAHQVPNEERALRVPAGGALRAPGVLALVIRPLAVEKSTRTAGLACAGAGAASDFHPSALVLILHASQRDSQERGRQGPGASAAARY
jgi:hypothetical protein